MGGAFREQKLVFSYGGDAATGHGVPTAWLVGLLSTGEFRGAVRASHLAKKSKDKTPGVFFHAAFDFDAPGPRNTAQKSKNKETTNS